MPKYAWSFFNNGMCSITDTPSTAALDTEMVRGDTDMMCPMLVAIF